MEVIRGTPSSSAPSLLISNACKNPVFHFKVFSQVGSWQFSGICEQVQFKELQEMKQIWLIKLFLQAHTRNSQLLRTTEKRLFCSSFLHVNKESQKHKRFLPSVWRLNTGLTFKLSKFNFGIHRVEKCSENGNGGFPVYFYRVVFGVMLAMTLNAAVTETPACKCCKRWISFSDRCLMVFSE